MIHSFLLIGQSNMAGRGRLSEAPGLDASHIKILRNGRWQGLFRPVNPDRSSAGFNLAESFAEQYSKAYHVDVGLIPCADGGTSLDQWQPGGLLYDNAICQARLAQRTSTIAGVLWHQGESDCYQSLYPVYREKLAAFISALRTELDLFDVPFLMGGLGDFLPECLPAEWETKNYSYINEALQSLASDDLRIGFVSAKGLTSLEDMLHFNTPSLYEFGLRYFAEFQRLRDPDKVFSEKPHPDHALRTAMEKL